MELLADLDKQALRDLRVFTNIVVSDVMRLDLDVRSRREEMEGRDGSTELDHGDRRSEESLSERDDQTWGGKCWPGVLKLPCRWPPQILTFFLKLCKTKTAFFSQTVGPRLSVVCMCGELREKGADCAYCRHSWALLKHHDPVVDRRLS